MQGAPTRKAGGAPCSERTNHHPEGWAEQPGDLNYNGLRGRTVCTRLRHVP